MHRGGYEYVCEREKDRHGDRAVLGWGGGSWVCLCETETDRETEREHAWSWLILLKLDILPPKTYT